MVKSGSFTHFFFSSIASESMPAEVTANSLVGSASLRGTNKRTPSPDTCVLLKIRAVVDRMPAGIRVGDVGSTVNAVQTNLLTSSIVCSHAILILESPMHSLMIGGQKTAVSRGESYVGEGG